MDDQHTSNLPEFDFYISANAKSAAAQEVVRILEHAGYSVYLPKLNGEGDADQLAASKSKAFVLLLLNDSDQSRCLADILNFWPLGIGDGRLIIVQFEECEQANLIEPNFITNLTGLTNSRARKLRIIDAVEMPAPSNVIAQAEELRSQLTQCLRKIGQDDQQKAIQPGANGSPEGLPQHVSLEEVRRPRPQPSGRVLLLPDHRPTRLEPTRGSADPATDDPLVTLVEILSKEEHSSIPAPSSPIPKWLAKELLVVRDEPTARCDATGQDNEEGRRKPRKDILEFSVSHPTHFWMGTPFIIDVVIHRNGEARLAVQRAVELSVDNERVRSANVNKVAPGTRLSIAITLPWSAEPQVQTIYWNDMIANVSFQVLPPRYAASKTARGTCRISVDGLTIGRVLFQLRLGQGEVSDDRHVSRAQAIRSAFACYARRDRLLVRDRLLSIEKLGVNVLIDVATSGADEQSRQRNFQAIDSSDTLYLFWSGHAKRSNWFEQQWRYGMQKNGAGFIDLVPLVDPRRAPPPIDLVDQRQLSDWAFLYSEHEKSLGTWTRIRSWFVGLY